MYNSLKFHLIQIMFILYHFISPYNESERFNQFNSIQGLFKINIQYNNAHSAAEKLKLKCLQ